MFAHLLARSLGEDVVHARLGFILHRRNSCINSLLNVRVERCEQGSEATLASVIFERAVSRHVVATACDQKKAPPKQGNGLFCRLLCYGRRLH